MAKKHSKLRTTVIFRRTGRHTAPKKVKVKINPMGGGPKRR